MSSPDSTVECGEHGEAQATYVCEHLAENPSQEWYCDVPAEDNPWPDAWCAKCNAIFLREGEWNERNESEMRIKLLCAGCYEDGLAASAERLEGKPLRAWNAFVKECCTALEPIQERLVRAYGLDKHKRWDWDQASGSLTFSNDGIPAVRARIQFIGSFSPLSNTWLWAWANFSIDAPNRALVEKVRELGEERDFPKLTTWKWNATEHDGWHMAAIAARVMGAKGIYRAPSDTGPTFLSIMDAEHV